MKKKTAKSKPKTSVRQPAKGCRRPSVCSPLARAELEEARALILECARKRGELDAREGVTIPPAEFCEDNKVSKMLRDAWLEGWYSANQ